MYVIAGGRVWSSDFRHQLAIADVLRVTVAKCFFHVDFLKPLGSRFCFLDHTFPHSVPRTLFINKNRKEALSAHTTALHLFKYKV
ncbi:unnamed protein product [Heterotrigona itama]|uniref:Uncharacterized protein n=1 Tax=Heterotrigona itama TaxID=395501 RepID=A0A6V7GZH0_9HYME|nr:unnamed protein product [Heterotrigona itama]